MSSKASAKKRPMLDAAGLEQAIARAQHGRVSVSPDKAVEMAGKLYGDRKYTQAERVCRQLIAARPVKTASVAQVRKPIYNTAVK